MKLFFLSFLILFASSVLAEQPGGTAAAKSQSVFWLSQHTRLPNDFSGGLSCA